MFVSFKIAIKEIQGMLRVLSFSLLGFYISSCQKINSEKEEVLVRVVYDLITYDATDVPDIEILDSDNNKCWLSDQIDKDKIIFYLPNLGCSSCYEQEIALIKEMIPSSMKNKVMVVGNFLNIRELKLFERNSNLNSFKIEGKNDLFPLIPYNDISVVFILTEQMKCYALFDAVNNAKASKLYYKIIVDKMSIER